MSNGVTAWDDKTSPNLLRKALDEHDDGTAGALIDALCADLDKLGRLMDAKAAKQVLSVLQQHTLFRQLKRVATTLERHAQNDVQVLLHLAQARIELGELTTAISELTKLQKEVETELKREGMSPFERQRLERYLGEALGLLGRAYKQLYVDAHPSPGEPRAYDYDCACRYYGSAFEQRLGDYPWHGINSVALVTHRHRVERGVPNATAVDAQKRAREILEHVEERERAGKLESWDYANRIEASLAIGDTRAAIEATAQYLQRANAFEIRSTRRQLVELWLLTDDRPPGDTILPLMNARFAELGGGRHPIELRPDKAASYGNLADKLESGPDFEKVWGTTTYKSLRWLNEGLSRAACVARVGPNKYDGTGTGFLFDGAWISDAFRGRSLLLTNAHVCSNDEAVLSQHPFPSRPQDLTATFLGDGTASEADEIPFGEVLWTSPPSELDATLVMLPSAPKGSKPPPITERKPPVATKGDARLNILGHPKGLDLRISMQDNVVVEVGERYVHYRTPTDGGSSGSPVFNQKWELVALHHGASKARSANEGIRIDVIIEAIRMALGSP